MILVIHFLVPQLVYLIIDCLREKVVLISEDSVKRWDALVSVLTVKKGLLEVLQDVIRLQNESHSSAYGIYPEHTV